MASLSEIRSQRIEKLKKLSKEGINPYPALVGSFIEAGKILSDFDELLKSKKEVTTVGRVKAIRGQGAILFVDLFDDGKTIQGLVKKEDIEEGRRELFIETVDIGDFIKISGSLFVTKREEKTILVTDWEMLSKSLRPLPDKWHGLKDTDERFRRRYLDSLMDESVRLRFITRSKLIKNLRTYLDEKDFLEVETPMLQPIAGGANAMPFVTHHNALDIDLYLRIAPELYLKEMLVGGYNKVYELNRNFRNEGIDVTHNPEFTMLEFYEAYKSAEEQRGFVEEMVRSVMGDTSGSPKVSFSGNEIDFGKKFETITYKDLIKKYTKIDDFEKISKDELTAKAEELGVDVAPADSVAKILDNIYKKYCRPKIIQPTFVIWYPTEIAPLAKKTPDGLADKFQLIAGGLELVNAYSELNDPIDQKERFGEQENLRAGGDSEAQAHDESYIEAMEYGMPPATGVGLGIDRLVMILSDTENIREVVYFPTMRPKD